MTRKLSVKEVCLLLGYELWRNKKDNFGVLHAYKTTPLSGNGGHNYFNSLNAVEKWTLDVMNFRYLCYDGKPLSMAMLERSNQLLQSGYIKKG